MALAVNLAAVLLLGRADLGDPRPRLEIVDQRAERVVYSRPVIAGERFQLTHTHSVTRRPVEEIFSVGPKGIHLEELRFDEFGPNLPSGPERIDGVTTTFRHVAGEYRVSHHGRPLGTLPLLTGGPKVDHAVIFADGRRVRLLDVAPPRSPVELRIRGRE